MSTRPAYDLPIEPADPNAEYLKIQEVAWIFNCSVRTIRRAINQAGAPHSRPGRQIMLSREDRAELYELRRGGARPIRRTRTGRPRKTAAVKPTASKTTRAAA